MRRSFHGLGRPFHGRASTTTSLSGATLNGWSPGDSGVALPVAGAGQEYFLEQVHIDTDVPATLTLLGDTTPVYGPKALPAGFGVIPFPARSGCGLNAQLKVSLAATAGGNVSGSLDVFGYLGPQ